MVVGEGGGGRRGRGAVDVKNRSKQWSLAYLLADRLSGDEMGFFGGGSSVVVMLLPIEPQMVVEHRERPH